MCSQDQLGEKPMKINVRIATFVFALFTSMTIFAAPARAVPHWHGAVPRWHGDIRHFHEHDLVVWRGGRWVHGWHVGRFGWWWTVPGGWYFYPAPVYPYPDPYVPPVVAVQPVPPPVAQAQPQAQTWYYCDRPAGSIRTCRSVLRVGRPCPQLLHPLSHMDPLHLPLHERRQIWTLDSSSFFRW